jgi:hypothetical protein
MATSKNIITYSYLTKVGEPIQVQIFNNGILIDTILAANQGWNTSEQENTLSRVEDYAEKIFGKEDFVLPYYVDGAGYVRSEK